MMNRTDLALTFGEKRDQPAPEADQNAAAAARRVSRDVLERVLADPHPNVHVRLDRPSRQRSSFSTGERPS